MSAYILTVPPFQNGPGNPNSQDTVMQDLLAVQPRGEEALGEDRGEWDPRVMIEEQTEGGAKVDPKLQSVVEGIFRRCIQDGEYKQVSRMTYARHY